MNKVLFGKQASGTASAKAKRMRSMGRDPDIITEHRSIAENEHNTVMNIKQWMKRRYGVAALLTLLWSLPVLATIVPGVPDKLIWNRSSTPGVTYLVFRGPTNGTWIATNAVTSTNFWLTNITFGNWTFVVRAVSTNGVQSDSSPSIVWTNNPDAPTGLTIEPTSNSSAVLWVPLPFGTAIVESSPDVVNWTPFISLKNLSVDPTRELGIRVQESDPRKFYRPLVPATQLLIRTPPTP